jgi:glutamine synthetase
MEETTLFMQCDVIEPADGKGYDRDPRSIAKRAEAYLKSSGMGDTAYFGPEPEFFIFDSVRWKIDMSGCFVKVDSTKHRGRPTRKSKAATAATVQPSRAATSQCHQSTASRTCVRKCA